MAKNEINYSRRASQPVQHASLEVYETITSLNLGFEHALKNLTDLKRFGVFRGIPSYFFNICSVTLEEMRAWT